MTIKKVVVSAVVGIALVGIGYWFGTLGKTAQTITKEDTFRQPTPPTETVPVKTPEKQSKADLRTQTVEKKENPAPKIVSAESAQTKATEEKGKTVPPKKTDEKKEIKQEWFSVIGFNYNQDSPNRIYVTFSHDVANREKLPELIKFNPMPRGGFHLYHWSNTEFVIEANYAPNTVYQVQMLPGIKVREQKGKVIHTPEKALNFAFRTSDFTEWVSFHGYTFIYPLHATGVREYPINYRSGRYKPQLTFDIYEAFDNNLSTYLKEDYSLNSSRKIGSCTLPVAVGQNQRITAALDLDKVGLPRKPGFYTLRATVKNGYSADKIRLVLTNLSIHAVQDAAKINVLVSKFDKDNPSDTTFAVPNATVKLVTHKNQTVGTAKTDKNGRATFDLETIHGNITENDYLKFVFAESADGKDKSYFNIESGMSGTEQKNCDPIATCGNYGHGDMAYVYMERDICRPGESISMFGMVRNIQGNMMTVRANTPVVWYIYMPGGGVEVFNETTGKTDTSGLVSHRINIPHTASTGTYNVVLKVPGDKSGKSLGEAFFTVSEFVPDELKVTARSAYNRPNRQFAVSGNAMYYFGTPLANKDIKVRYDAEWANYKSKRHSDYTFGKIPKGHPYDKSNTPFDKKAKETLVKTTENGGFEHIATIPELENAVMPITVRAMASASADGGRTVTASTEYQTIHFAKYYVGLKEAPEQSDDQWRDFLLKFVTPQDEDFTDFANLKLTAELYSIDWVYTVQSEGNGRDSWDWQIIERCVESGMLGQKNFDAGAVSFEIPLNGHYVLRIKDDKGNIRAEKEFWHYAGEAGNFASNDRDLKFKLNNDTFQPGEVAQLTFRADVVGEALVCSGALSVDSVSRVPIKLGMNTVSVQIPANCERGYYFVHVNTYGKQPGDELNNSVNVSGTACLKIKQDKHKLHVNVIPITMGHGYPEQDYEFMAQVLDTNKKTVPNASVNVWAVDEGVLALTNFKTPDPFQFFYGAYDCHYQAGSNYCKLFYRHTLQRKLFGGGGSAKATFFSDELELRKETAVFHLGTVKTDVQGIAQLKVKLPKHTGAMRIMAVAATDSKMGSGEAELLIRDAISVKVAQPRVLAPKDTFTLQTLLFNHDSDDANAEWTFSNLTGAELSGASSAKLQLPKGNSNALVPLTLTVKSDAKEIRGTFTLKVGKHLVKEELQIAVRAPYARETKVTRTEIKPGTEMEFAQSGLFTRTDVGSPILSIQQGLEFLNSYPYGCLEQTISGAFPLLAVKPLADAGLIDKVFVPATDTKIQSVKQYLNTLEYCDMNYKMWPCSNNCWEEGSIYTWHFLLELDKAGYPLSDKEKRQIFERLCSKQKDPYAIYVLSLVDAPRAGQYAEVFLLMEKKASIFARFLATVAYIRGGHAADGMQALQKILEEPFWEVPINKGNCLDKRTQRLGLALWLLSDIVPDSPVLDRLVQEIGNEVTPEGHWGTTQNNAWCVMGLAKFVQIRNLTDARGTLTIDGKTATLDKRATFGYGKTVHGKIINTGKSPLYLYQTAKAVPEIFTPHENGFRISREYFNEDGQKVNEAKLGELLKVKITVSKMVSEPCQNIVICDLLPGGLEIEDGKLKTRVSRLHNNDEDLTTLGIFEKRYDRMVIFFDLNKAQQEFTYRVRATTAGKFIVPPVQVESMYLPSMNATARSSEYFEVK